MKNIGIKTVKLVTCFPKQIVGLNILNH